MSKTVKIILIVVAVLVLLAGGFFGYQKYLEYYNAHYIVIDDVEYDREITSLDLSGTTIGELEKLCELTCLESLNLQDTGITTTQYDTLTTALPNCAIRWSVPFQDDFVDCDIEELILTTINPEDLDALAYLPQLTTVKADACKNYTTILEMQERYPDLTVSYTVELGGKEYSNSTSGTLDISDPNADELMEKLVYLPDVTTVNLTGELPANEIMKQLQQAYTDITFVYDFEVFGVPTNSLADFLDLSGIQFSSTEDIDAIVPQFYNLTKVDMIDCGISNEEMEALNQRHPDTLFVWTVKIKSKAFRTDITEMIPVKHNLWVKDADCYNLRYFTELVALDLGHMHISNCDFVAYMPNLKYLILADTQVADLTPLMGLKNLVFLEIFRSYVYIYDPLLALTSLEDLNICHTYGDPYIIAQMPWLKRLWFGQEQRLRIADYQQQAIIDGLPDTKIEFYPYGCTGSGWRQGQHYYDMRDLFGMDYMAF